MGHFSAVYLLFVNGNSAGQSPLKLEQKLLPQRTVTPALQRLEQTDFKFWTSLAIE